VPLAWPGIWLTCLILVIRGGAAHADLAVTGRGGGGAGRSAVVHRDHSPGPPPPSSPDGSAATGASRPCTTSATSPTAKTPPRSAPATAPRSWPSCATLASPFSSPADIPASLQPAATTPRRPPRPGHPLESARHETDITSLLRDPWRCLWARETTGNLITPVPAVFVSHKLSRAVTCG